MRPSVGRRLAAARAMANRHVERMRWVVEHWGDPVFDEARRLEGLIADAAADALADAMIDAESFQDALAGSSLSDAEEELRAVHTMEREVMTGGFQQFLDDCGREEAVLAAAGCERIGAKRFVPILRDVLDLVAEVPEDDWPDELEEELNALDERFYDSYDEVEGLLRLRLAYASAHPAEFRALK